MRADVQTAAVSIVLPVRNCARRLEGLVQIALERGDAEAPAFEILIVDDGSEDGTDEVAAELARRFPQVRLRRHARPLGWDRAVADGLAACRAANVLVGSALSTQPLDGIVPAVHFRRMARPDGPHSPLPAMPADLPASLSDTLFERLVRWAECVAPRTADSAEPNRRIDTDRLVPSARSDSEREGDGSRSRRPVSVGHRPIEPPAAGWPASPTG